ncbi:MAG: hypothetical protein J6T12_03835 [Salinivirgaceae bacterium]|nr:hypothetical protein [Salinivirgaceae bacterium]
MANEIQNEPQEQEIDLIDLMSRACRWTGNLISKIFTTIIYFIIRNRYWYLLLFIIIAVTTIISYKTRDKLFTCSMIVETQRISASDVINLINQWNYNSDSTNISNHIKAIHGCYLLDFNKDGFADKIEDYTGRVVTDTSLLNKRMSDRFVVEAELFNADNNEVLIDVKTQLFNYLDNDPWVINCNNVIKDEQKNMIARIDKEIAQLDSLKNSEYFSESNQYKLDKNGGLMMVSEKDKHLYHNDIISLLSRKQKIERYLYDEPFKVIQDFSEPMQEDNDLFSILKTWLLIGLIFGSMLIIIIDNRKSIKTLIEKSDKK